MILHRAFRIYLNHQTMDALLQRFRSEALSIIVDSSEDDVLHLMLDDSDSEESEVIKNVGLRPGRKSNKDRIREHYDWLIFHDYWIPNPTHTNKNFRNTFRLPTEPFDEVVIRVQEYNG